MANAPPPPGHSLNKQPLSEMWVLYHLRDPAMWDGTMLLNDWELTHVKGSSSRRGRVLSAQPWPQGGHASLLQKEAGDPEFERLK